MEGILVAAVIVAAVVSRPLELRLWRAGRLSDRAAAILLLARFPIVCFLFGLIVGTSALPLVGITLLGALPGVVFYRFVLDLLRDQAIERGETR